MSRVFFSVLWHELQNIDPLQRRKLQRKIQKMAKTLRAENSVGDTQRNTLNHHRIACLVLSSYRVLISTNMDKGTVLPALETAIVKPGGWIVHYMTKIMLFFSSDPMTALVKYTSKNIPRQYGNTFTFEEKGDASATYTMSATKCFFHTFFTANAAPELTPLFCAWDAQWIKAISPEAHGVKFSRPTTMANGGDTCPFIFSRVDKKN